MKKLICFIYIFALIAFSSCSSQDTEEMKLLKIKIELLSSQIAALDSMERKAEQDWLRDSTYRKKNYIILEEFQEAFMDRIKFAR